MRLWPAALLSLVSLPAYALQIPPAAGEDAHVRAASYSPYNRTRIVGVMNHATTITYAPTERIVRVTLGSYDDWVGPDQAKVGSAPLKNNLPLWPLRVGETNMQVTTETATGGERLYQYEMVVHPDPGASGDDPDAVYGLIYTYPRDKAAAAAEAAKVRREVVAKRVTEDRLATDFFYGERNWRYVAQGHDRWMAPAEVSDNGRMTAFRFPGNQQIPAIYAVQKDGSEQLAPFQPHDDLIVAQGVSCHWRLRMGLGVLEVLNRGDCSGVGENPGTGTTSPDVVRQVVTKR